MSIVINVLDNSFVINGVQFEPGALFFSISDDGIVSVGNWSAHFTEIEVDGDTFSTLEEFRTALDEHVFASTGNTPVTNVYWSDIIGKPIGTDRQVAGFSSGSMTPVTLGWKQLSDLPVPPTFSNGVYVGTAFKPDGTALFAFIELSIDGNKASAIPMYRSGGRLSVGKATASDDAVNLGQLASAIGNATSSHTGLMTWQQASKLEDIPRIQPIDYFSNLTYTSTIAGNQVLLRTFLSNIPQDYHLAVIPMSTEALQTEIAITPSLNRVNGEITFITKNPYGSGKTLTYAVILKSTKA